MSLLALCQTKYSMAHTYSSGNVHLTDNLNLLVTLPSSPQTTRFHYETCSFRPLVIVSLSNAILSPSFFNSHGDSGIFNFNLEPGLNYKCQSYWDAYKHHSYRIPSLSTPNYKKAKFMGTAKCKTQIGKRNIPLYPVTHTGCTCMYIASYV